MVTGHQLRRCYLSHTMNLFANLVVNLPTRIPIHLLVYISLTFDLLTVFTPLVTRCKFNDETKDNTLTRKYVVNMV